jgi:peroxiredoxin
VKLKIFLLAVAACGPATLPRPATSVLAEWGSPQPGDAAPDFELPALRGAPVRLSSFQGRWVLLHFIASWCPYCDAEIAHLNEIAATHAADGLAVLLVDEREPLDRWTMYAQEKVSGQVFMLHDATGDTALRFVPPRAHPELTDRADAIFDSTLLIDPKGRIRLFLMPDSVHFDPTFPEVRAELADVLWRADRGPSLPGASRADGTLDAGHVVFVTSLPTSVAVGGEGEIQVVLHIAPGYHVMSDHPSKPNYIPTTIRLGDARDLAFGACLWPKSSSFDLGGESISTFEAEVVARIPVQVAAGAARGHIRVRGTLRYQACTRASCLYPFTIPFGTDLDLH